MSLLPAIHAPEKTAIGKRTFGEEWEALCQRFGREASRDEALRYLSYLEAMGVTEEDAISACRDLRATARFFPRPADFLAVRIDGEWDKLFRYATDNVCGTDENRNAWYREARQGIDPRSFEALDSLGGLSVIREARDLLRVRSAFFDAYERILALEAAQVTL